MPCRPVTFRRVGRRGTSRRGRLCAWEVRIVRNLESPRRLASLEDVGDFEQELVDQYALAMVGVGVGVGDSQVAGDRSTLFEFIGFLGRPVWTAAPADADRYLAQHLFGLTVGGAERYAHTTDQPRQPAWHQTHRRLTRWTVSRLAT